MPSQKLSIEVLENSGYNHAAELLAAGDERQAAVSVLVAPGRYNDDEDARVRALAREILS